MPTPCWGPKQSKAGDSRVTAAMTQCVPPIQQPRHQGYYTDSQQKSWEKPQHRS